MAISSLFIGVVSHERTRYGRSQGSEGLAAQLAASMGARGVPTTVIIDTSNRFDSTEASIGNADVQAALSAQLDLQSDWARYLKEGRSAGLRDWVTEVTRRARRALQRLKPPPPSAVERLLNIELAHRDLLRQGLDSQAPWILILEDDAWSEDVVDLTDGLVDLLGIVGSQVQFINLSESFVLAELGIDHLLVGSEYDWAGSAARSVVTATQPVTNTVCAIAYRSEFAAELESVYESMPMTPVVPIDWKLNKALMGMHASGFLPTGSCIWVTPGPIDQLSMRETP